MKFARSLLIFSYGLFTIAAQTLLFREFVTAFEGNDISVGVFFASWFLWVGLGALLVRRWDRLAEALVQHVESVFLLYIPAFLAQLLLIVQVRELAGVASYDLMSVQTIVLWAMVVNAPVSLVTGVLFPVACRWIERTDAFPVARVYVLEAAGSFGGGLAVTALLACHVDVVRVFSLLALALLVCVCVASLGSLFTSTRTGRPQRGAFGVSLILILLSGATIVVGADGILAQQLRTMKWKRLLPREAFTGAFYTAHAEYLHGEYGGQWVVMSEGSVCETLPNEEDAGRTAALALCQNPQARRVLVIGSGLALCGRLLALPQIEEVTWTHADGEYVKRLLARVPEKFGISDQRLHPVADEIRQYLRGTRDHFDLVIVNLPDVTGSAFNRYYTLEFYQQLKASLRHDGVVSISIAGGENIMGAELVSLGASAKLTLEKVFSQLVLVPGEQTWLIASDSKGLVDNPATLRDRFAALPGSPKVFPATGLLSVYLPDRAAQALQAYEKVNLPQELLLNRDSRPLTHLYGLLLAARQSGASVTRFVRLLAVSGWIPFIVPVLVFMALRLRALTGQKPGRYESSFDSSFLVFSTGWVGIAMVIILMYSYETNFGSLYLHVGVISSLFMVGLTAGALVIGRVIAMEPAADSGRRHLQGLLIGILLIHGSFLAAIGLSLTKGPAMLGLSGQGFFAVVFILSGLCCGGYWPVAAAQLGGKLDPVAAGGRLETADHLGACLGGLVTSLLMVPVLGIPISLLVLTGLLLANVPAAVATLWQGGAPEPADQNWGFKQVGYALFGVGACVVICSDIMAGAAARWQPALPEYAVHALAGEKQTQQASVVLQDDGRRANYIIVTDGQGEPTGYLFSSADFAPEVRGFGGRLNLAAHVDPSGKLVDLLIVRSNETPSYLELLRGWLDSLKGKALFDPEPFAGVIAVTGATISSEAVMVSLEKSGQRFAADALKTESAWSPARSRVAYLPDLAGWYLVGTFVLALLVAHRGGFRSRLVVLGFTFFVGGIFLNAQYSSEQIATVLSLDAPTAAMTGVFLLVVGVPVLVLLFGNLYCGYLCPFGAAQELLGYVLPRRFRLSPTCDEMRLARFIKYAVLIVLIIAFFVSRDRRTLAGDPLTAVFSLRPAASNWPAWMLAAVVIASVGSLFYSRFWCRYLCPVGAFLSLLNHVRLLRRWVPGKWFGRCEFGLTASDHLDCIYCDRCRYPQARHLPARSDTDAGKRMRPFAQPLLYAAVISGLFVAGVSLSRFRQVMPLILEEPVATGGAGGQPRDVDVQQIQTLIDQGRLSSRRAEYYKDVEGPDSAPEMVNEPEDQR